MSPGEKLGSPQARIPGGISSDNTTPTSIDGIQTFESLVMYGEGLEAFIFKIDRGYWQKKVIDKNSEYQGGIKHYGMCYTNSFKVFLTGGL